MIGHLPVPLWMMTRAAKSVRPKWHRIVAAAPSDVLGTSLVAVSACGLESGPLEVARQRPGTSTVVAGHWELSFVDRDPTNVHVCFTCATAVRAGRAA